jgi:hypothetical protein
LLRRTGSLGEFAQARLSQRRAETENKKKRPAEAGRESVSNN